MRDETVVLVQVAGGGGWEWGAGRASSRLWAGTASLSTWSRTYRVSDDSLAMPERGAVPPIPGPAPAERLGAELLGLAGVGHLGAVLGWRAVAMACQVLAWIQAYTPDEAA
jgi:hypothetical protein